MKAGITRPDTLTQCALSSSAPPDATLAAALHVGEALQRAKAPIHGSSANRTAHNGLRVAYLGGALVELAGAMIALVFVRNDSMGQRKR
jgi:hypothetical protein